MSSNPALQVYVAVSPIELPVDVTSPLLGLLGFEHRANKQTIKQSTVDLMYFTQLFCFYYRDTKQKCDSEITESCGIYGILESSWLSDWNKCALTTTNWWSWQECCTISTGG